MTVLDVVDACDHTMYRIMSMCDKCGVQEIKEDNIKFNLDCNICGYNDKFTDMFVTCQNCISDKTILNKLKYLRLRIEKRSLRWPFLLPSIRGENPDAA